MAQKSRGLQSRVAAKSGWRLGFFFACSALAPLLAVGAEQSAAETLDRIPPASTNQVDFVRDIQPIFERTCFRCHGPEKPKSKFRLDNRETALKGGENEGSKDIIPGNSRDSRLIHYIAGLDPELQMPPPGKGEPLTRAEISTLRAWIDQGAPWSAVSAGAVDAAATLTGGGYIVSGDRSMFRELLWKPAGGNGGLEQFSITDRLDAWSRFFIEGHALQDDAALKLRLERSNLGFVNVGVEQYRKYYSDSGGYYPLFSPPIYSLGR